MPKSMCEYRYVVNAVRSRRRLPLTIVIVGLAVFFGLAVGARTLFNQQEDRLLQQRVNEAVRSCS